MVELFQSSGIRLPLLRIKYHFDALRKEAEGTLFYKISHKGLLDLH